LPLREVPPSILARLGTRTAVYVVLEEDLYETKFGDGRFLYPREAFLDEASARRWMERRMTEGLAYRIKAVRVEREESRLVAELALENGERCSLKDLVRLLEAVP
jgi:hypothetical protein